MKLYIISGLGADFKVLEKLNFPDHLEIVFLDWLIPVKGETFQDYVGRMAARIDDSKEFCLLGYSFGGILVQEVHKLKPALKVVILGSIKSEREKSRFIKAGSYTGIPKYLPEKFFNDNTTQIYSSIRKLFDRKNPSILEYFNVRDPYYLKWSIEQVAAWKGEEDPRVIQIMGDKDIVFPIGNSKPDYVIKGGTHLFPATKYREVSLLLEKIF
ncbi:MAG: alpha/beta hydrolase [Weeksellaceae bacterium]|nr:alpha/beta hydrolase [Weeksellaceae bacterium]